MIRAEFQFDFSELKLNVASIERVIGYKNGESNEMISEMISSILEEAGKISEIRAEYALFDKIRLIPEEKSIEIDNVIFNVNRIIYSQVKLSTSIALFLCTAGPGTGSRSRALMNEGDLLAGYIWDVTGSEIVEAAADLMQEDLERRLAAEGLNITNRFSPGYCGWDVAEQHKLFSLLPGNLCKIRLTESALMDPIKSVSGIIGAG
ncbi:MAG: hypothetical protein HPY62_11170, partial [Bacteroidales bacterium]|nr:hypothetical protein [Bacteroidales bacterium]